MKERGLARKLGGGNHSADSKKGRGKRTISQGVNNDGNAILDLCNGFGRKAEARRRG